MRNPVLVVCLSACSALYAQVELLSSTMPSFGTVVTYQAYNLGVIDTTVQGSNVTWDFSELVSVGDEWTNMFMDPADTPYGTVITNTNYARMYTNSGITQYYYYANSDTHLDLVGLWTLSTGAYALSMRELVFPMTLGTQYNASIGNESTSIAGVGTGTLVLPSGTFTDVVMVRRMLDSQSGLFYHFYEWYSTESGALLLYFMSSNDGLIPVDGGVVTDISTSVSAHAGSNDFLRCAGPVTDELEVVFGSATSGMADLVVTNTVGQALRTTVIAVTPGQQRSRLFVGDLARGAYLLTLRPRNADSALRTLRFVKQ